MSTTMKTQEAQQESDADAKAASAPTKSRGRSFEVTGLGIVAALIVAFWSLVSDGTIPFNQYLVFLSFMLVGAAGLVWRLFKLAPGGRLKNEKTLRAGVYRVSFGGRGSR
jgi:hypothetical protein